MNKIWRAMTAVLSSLLLLVLTIWGTLGYVFCSWSLTLRFSCAALYLAASLLTVLTLRPWRMVRHVLFALFLIVVVSWTLMWPSNDRDWQEPCARPAYATTSGATVTLHNIRNFDYSSESEYVADYYEKTFMLSELESVDVYLVNWGIEQVSHAMVSFGFGNDDYLCFSFETRKERGEAYSALKSFFRKYELYCVVADERDLVRLRTNFREGKDVYLYRMKPVDMKNVRALFIEYVEMVNSLRRHPDWYNALTDNCMTAAFKLARMNAATGGDKWHWKIFLNGYADELAYEKGSIDTTLPFERMKKASHINERAKAVGDSPEFSRLIREGLPGMGKSEMAADAKVES